MFGVDFLIELRQCSVLSCNGDRIIQPVTNGRVCLKTSQEARISLQLHFLPKGRRVTKKKKKKKPKQAENSDGNIIARNFSVCFDLFFNITTI